MSTLEADRQLTHLDDLLVEGFSGSEFMRLVERCHGPAVLADLPVSAESPRLYMYHAVRALQRLGLLNAPFFDGLAAARPAHERVIRRIAVAFVHPSGPVANLSAATAVQLEGPRLSLVEAIEQHLLDRERLPAADDRSVALEQTIDALARKLRDVPLLTPGSTLAGTRLERILGTGNFGTVWRARHTASGRRVAVKVFHLDRLTDGVMLWRFRRSIRALQALNRYRDKPASIPLFLGHAPDYLAFVMPHYPGGTLEQVERRGWSLATKIAVFLEVCLAVQFAHRVGVIHRDIKPANVLLDDAHRPVLVDYDIADISFVTQLADAQGGLGTPVFAAPEQLEDAAAADERSDIYSLGRLLHYLLLERSPGYQIERDPGLDSLRGFHPALIAAVRRATQWDPRRRHTTIDALVADVERYKSGYAALRARSAASWRWVRHNAVLLGACTAVTAAAVTVAATESAATAAIQRSLEVVREATRRNDANIANISALTTRVDALSTDLAALAGLPEAQVDPRLTRISESLAQLCDDLATGTTAITDEQTRLHAALRDPAPAFTTPTDPSPTLAARHLAATSPIPAPVINPLSSESPQPQDRSKTPPPTQPTPSKQQVLSAGQTREDRFKRHLEALRSDLRNCLHQYKDDTVRKRSLRLGFGVNGAITRCTLIGGRPSVGAKNCACKIAGKRLPRVKGKPEQIDYEIIS
ncbi:MAG: protein kinase [Myxococcales bacterium]|nr:protein kinase [Myxococcales bacterium]